MVAAESSFHIEPAKEDLAKGQALLEGFLQLSRRLVTAQVHPWRLTVTLENDQSILIMPRNPICRVLEGHSLHKGMQIIEEQPIAVPFLLEKDISVQGIKQSQRLMSVEQRDEQPALKMTGKSQPWEYRNVAVAHSACYAYSFDPAEHDIAVVAIGGRRRTWG